MSFYSGWNPGPNEINGSFAIYFSGAKIFSLDAHDIFFLTFSMMKQPWFWLVQGINSISQLEQNSNQTSGIFADAALFRSAMY